MTSDFSKYRKSFFVLYSIISFILSLSPSFLPGIMKIMIEIFQQSLYNKIKFYEDKLLNESYYKDRTPLSPCPPGGAVMNYFSIVLEQVEVFVVYLLIGIIAVKTNVLNREKLGALSSCVTKILLPLLIFSNAINGATKEQFLSSTVILLLTAVFYLVLYLTTAALSKLLRLDAQHKNLYRACSMFGNCGFMGIPIIIALYPKQGGIYIAVFTVIDQLVLWTIGLNLTSPPDSQTSVSLSKRLIKMINPATIAITTGVFLVLTGIKLPAAVVNALAKTGSAASPLAMIYLGGVFCYIKIRNYLKCREIYATVLIKMVLLPIAFYTVMHHISSIDRSIAVTLSVLCALPSMASIAMIAETQHSDGDYAAGMIFITTLFSIITLPLVCLSL